MTDNDDRPLRWDADMLNLFEWYHTCPKPWNPHWFESEVGGVTLHITRPTPTKNKDNEELTDSQKLDLARGRPVRDGS